MKITKILTVMLLFVATIYTSKVNAQHFSPKNPSKFYFAWAYSYNTNEPVMIISEVKHSKCLGVSGYGINETDVRIQWQDYIKSEYKDYFKFTKEASENESEAKSQKYRRKIMGNWQHKIIKIDDFKVYCD